MDDEHNRSPTRLVPARPDMRDAHRSGFLPRIPWRYLAAGLAIVGVIVTGYTWRQRQRAAELRVELRQTHASQQADADHYAATLAKIARLIGSAAATSPTDLVDPALRFETLRGTEGLYLRLPLAQTSSATQIKAAALAMEPDWIPGCLGLAPRTARELYEIGAFLLPSFVAHLNEEDVMKLRVRQDTLQRRIDKDLPRLRASMDARWLMLVLQEGESRVDEPVRVFIWDLHQDKLLLRARVRAQGILLTSRILSRNVDSGSATASNAEPSSRQGGAAAANDCSIASALKRLVRGTRD